MNIAKLAKPGSWRGLRLPGVLLLAISLGACTSPFGLFERKLDSRNQGDRSGSGDKGNLILSFTQAGSGARTINAPAVAPNDLSYTIRLERPGFSTIELPGLAYDAGGLQVPDLEPGDWQLTVEAFLLAPPSLVPAFRGSLPVTVNAGSNPVSLTLYRLQEGTGELQLLITWTVDNPADPPVDNFSLKWTSNLTDFINGLSDTPPLLASLNDSSGSFSLEEEFPIPSDYYYLTIIWKKGLLEVGRTIEAVHIHDTLRAEKTINLPPGSFSSAPLAPENLTLSYNRDGSFALTSIALAWDDLAHTETGYKVYRTINAGIQELLDDTLSANATSFMDSDVSGLVLGNTVEYHIVAVNSFGESQLNGPASTLYTLSWSNGGATAGDPPLGGMVFSGERIFLPEHGNLRGPYVPGTGDAATQRFLGWNDGITTRLSLEPFDVPSGDVLLTATWTDDATVLRKIGPAGGYIFYENPNPDWAIDDGWRYMEAAPTDNNTNWISGGSTQTTFNGNTQIGVGTGKLNSLYIIAQPDHAGGAAGVAANTVVNGYSDWFLPSEAETSLIFSNLWQSDFLGQFQSPEAYWTSTEVDATQARTLGFSFGDLSTATKASFKQFRPVRAFRSSVQTWLVRYDANGADSGDAPVDMYHYENGQGFVPPGQGSLTKAGHIFAGWNTQPDGSGGAYPSGKNAIVPGGYFVLYARWLPWPNVQYRDLTSVPGGTFNQNFSGNWYAHTLSSYRLGTYEVTYELWYTVRLWAQSNGYTFANLGTEGVFGNVGGVPGARKHDPVNYISWHDVLVWCNAYSELEGLDPPYRNPSLQIIKDATNIVDCNSAVWDRAANGYRMPTAGEFNHAARWQGGYTAYADGAEEYPVSSGRWWSLNTHATGSGDLASNNVTAGLVAWYSANAGGNTNAVGLKAPNALGIYDMAGNVNEWHWDATTGTNPGGPTTDFAADSGANRSMRGGAYNSPNSDLQIGVSSGTLPESASQTYGFRVARTTPAGNYSVNYHANGAHQGSIPTPEYHPNGSNVTVKQNTGGLSRAGFVFVGWNTAPDGTGADFAADGSAIIVSLPGHQVLYAKWDWMNYQLRDTGPTGGLIFHVNPNFAVDGWKYLEAAPVNQTSSAWSNITDQFANGVASLQPTIGLGPENTLVILNQAGHTGSAARVTREYALNNGGILFRDWFLPSRDEAGEMAWNLHGIRWNAGTENNPEVPVPLGGFTTANYWTSSEVGATNGTAQSFNNGSQTGNVKNSVYNVRAVRRF